MPTYEYLCKACGHEFEREQRITDPKVRTCPKCRKRRVERLISQTSFVLKGGGWYSDLYSRPKPGGAKEAAGDAPKESASDAKTDAKPETKPEKKSKEKPASKGKSPKAAA